METRRSFFQKIRSALVGGTAVAVIAPAIVSKVASKETFWWLKEGTNVEWKGFIPAKDQTFRGVPIVREFRDGPDQIVCSRGMYDYLQSTGRFQNGRIS